MFICAGIASIYIATVSELRKTAPPILVADLFPDIRKCLLDLLESLSPADWERPTAAPLWSVKDIALHLLGGDLGNLSRRRDKFVRKASVAGYQDLVDFINNLNDEWVRAARRLSPRTLCDLLAFTGPQTGEYFASLNPFDLSEAVSWAGPEPAPVWLDVAREYTEQWHHQQQIRDAADKPPLYQARLFAPVLDTFMRATPHHYRDLAAPQGTCIAIQITGEAGGAWFLNRGLNAWDLLVETEGAVRASVSIPQDAAWRMFTKGLASDRARDLSTITGDATFAEPFFSSIAVIG